VNLLIVVINNEELLDQLITGWLDIGITGATVAETTDLIQLISHHIPIFAGFRSLTSGGTIHNKTLFTAIENRETLDKAVAYLEMICAQTGKPHQGVYFIAPIKAFGRLGQGVDPMEHLNHMEKKLGKPLKEKISKASG
jgi:nitrogen regulatory protein P-II 1